MLPADDAVALQARPEEVAVGRSIEIVTHVFLAGPHHLDRSRDLFGDACGGVRHIRLQLSTEAPAEQMVVHRNLAFRQACGLGHGGVDPLHDLSADPSLSRSRRDMHRAVQGLHTSVSQQRQLKCRGDNLARSLAAGSERLLHIADLLRNCTVAQAGAAQPRPDQLGGHLGIRPVIPSDVERGEPALCSPHMVADDRHQIIQHHDLSHSGNRFSSTIIDVRDRTTEHGARRVGRELHSRRQDVDAVRGLAIDLVGSVEAL